MIARLIAATETSAVFLNFIMSNLGCVCCVRRCSAHPLPTMLAIKCLQGDTIPIPQVGPGGAPQGLINRSAVARRNVVREG